jgi:hypothetical protein
MVASPQLREAMQKAGIIEIFPAAIFVALLAAAIAIFFYLLSRRYDLSEFKRWMLVLLLMFGTWMWCNLAFGGAWQLTLGLAVLGQLGALYFILCRPSPVLAGLLFALAFGNRTEVILTAPLLMYLACRDRIKSPREMLGQRTTLLKFSAVPVALGLATLAYNSARFHSPFDFGYARIPGVLDEPWYRHGIFSLHSIPLNMKAMLFETWKKIGHYPHYTPTGFGGSILVIQEQREVKDGSAGGGVFRAERAFARLHGAPVEPFRFGGVAFVIQQQREIAQSRQGLGVFLPQHALSAFQCAPAELFR